MKLYVGAVIVVLWLLCTISAAALVPEREQPRPIAYTHPDDLQRDFPTVDASPGQAAHWLRTVQLNKLSTQPRARSGPTTTTATVPRPVPRRTYPAGVEQWRSLVAQYPWPVDTMLAIMRCESGGRADAVGVAPYYAKGLFQLVPGPVGWDDPATNIRLAYETKYVPSGLTPWDASSGCW